MIETILKKHENVIFFCSGGRDSMAVWHLLKPYLDKIYVGWVDTNNNVPEVKAYMTEVSKQSPKFIRYKSDQPKWVEENGMPSEVVPIDNTPLGQRYAGQKQVTIVDYFQCCSANIHQPLYKLAKHVNATAVITGQRSSDGHKDDKSSGDYENGFQYFFPIEDWSDDDVKSYLKSKGETDPRFDIHHSSIDCLTCTAFCKSSPQRMDYLQKNHPTHFNELVRRLKIIRNEITNYTDGIDAVINGNFKETVDNSMKTKLTESLPSDIRLKENIEHLETVEGIRYYTWDWNQEAKRVGLNHGPTWGVMAQEVQKTHPQAIVEGPQGYLLVNYGALPE